jgi:hypothetical protein
MGDAGDRDADAGTLVVDARSGGLAQDATKSSARASILIMPCNGTAPWRLPRPKMQKLVEGL